MVTPPWMQAVVPRVVDHAASADALDFAVKTQQQMMDIWNKLLELHDKVLDGQRRIGALEDQVTGLRTELELARKSSVPIPLTPISAETLEIMNKPFSLSAEALEIASGYWNGSAF